MVNPQNFKTIILTCYKAQFSDHFPLIYINDLPLGWHSIAKLFAYDILSFSVIHDVDASSSTLTDIVEV